MVVLIPPPGRAIQVSGQPKLPVPVILSLVPGAVPLSLVIVVSFLPLQIPWLFNKQRVAVLLYGDILVSVVILVPLPKKRVPKQREVLPVQPFRAPLVIVRVVVTIVSVVKIREEMV